MADKDKDETPAKAESKKAPVEPKIDEEAEAEKTAAVAEANPVK